ncbi:uncharacterized protein TNCV_1791671 [Trichonephila clavipes]|nr:uncharacterized protein TNCV_1791671 [Trichonephila clavipes]
MEAHLSAFENFLQTTDAKRLKGSSPMLMEFLIPIFHIFSGLVVKKLPSSSVSPSGPPTEDSSDAPTHEALDNAYQHIRDLEKQVALSEGKLQESQRCFDSVISSLASHIGSTVSCVSDLKSSMEHNTDTLASLPAIIAKPSYAQVASSPAAVSSFTIPPLPSEQVLLVRPLEPNAGSSTTRNKITSFLLSKNLPFRITRIKNINNGGIAICLTTDEDVSKLSQELSNNADFASFSISKPVQRLGPTFHGPRSAVGNPDLTLTSCDLISFVENWEILSTESLSDHSFISVHLRCDLIFSDFVFKTKYGINKFIYNFRKNYNLINSFLTNISSIELLDDFASLLINTTNTSAFSTLRKRRVLNTTSFKWWNNSLRIQRNQLNAYKRRVVSLTTHGISVDEIASMHSSSFGKLSSPTNLHQMSTGDPASLFHRNVSLLLDCHFPSGSSRIPLVSLMTALLLHA